MGQVGTGSGPLIGLSLLFGAVCLSSGTALAVPVTEYITVQPIDVCGAVCAPVNNKGLTSVGAVGFIDPSGGQRHPCCLEPNRRRRDVYADGGDTSTAAF